MAKIIVVDDSAFERQVIIDILKKEGYEVLGAESGEKGVELFLTEKPDLVLMDLRMPGISGSDAMKKIIGKDPQAKVIVISIARDDGTMNELIGMGAKAYVTKPVTSGKLIPAVKGAIGK